VATWPRSRAPPSLRADPRLAFAPRR
jgi:hypothetical protein